MRMAGLAYRTLARSDIRRWQRRLWERTKPAWLRSPQAGEGAPGRPQSLFELICPRRLLFLFNLECIRENDMGRFAAQFQIDALEVRLGRIIQKVSTYPPPNP